MTIDERLYTIQGGREVGLGVSTNTCVLYTSADARNICYEVTVYKEGLASFDQAAHALAL